MYRHQVVTTVSYTCMATASINIWIKEWNYLYILRNSWNSKYVDATSSSLLYSNSIVVVVVAAANNNNNNRIILIIQLLNDGA